MKPGLTPFLPSLAAATALAALSVLAPCRPAAAAPPPVEHEILFTNLPVLPFGGEYIIVSYASGIITSADVTISLITDEDFDAANFVFEFVGPTGALVASGSQLGWSGQGSFTTTFTTQNFYGELQLQGRGPSSHFYFMNASTTNPLNPGSGSLADSRIVFTVQPCLVDFDGDFRLTVGDIFSFLNAYFADSPAADLDLSGLVAPGDIFRFLEFYFAGCDAF